MSTVVAAPQTSTTTWNLDPAHSTVEFKVKHMMISNVKGNFTRLSATWTGNHSDLANSRLEAAIEAASIDTHDALRDAHLKSADFLDVEKFPTLSFQSTRIERRGEGEVAVEGDLTIHGVTRKAVFTVEGPTAPAQDPWGHTRVAVAATTRISRKDFGLTWNAALESGGFLVGDDVSIMIEGQFVKA